MSPAISHFASGRACESTRQREVVPIIPTEQGPKQLRTTNLRRPVKNGLLIAGSALTHSEDRVYREHKARR